MLSGASSLNGCTTMLVQTQHFAIPVHEMRAGEEIYCKHQAKACLYLKWVNLLEEEGTSTFKKHAATECHHESIQALIVLPMCT